MYEPLPGDILFRSLKDKGAIIMAANARITKGIAKGIFRAAKDLDSAIIFEIARSECNLNRGYTGLLPNDYARHIQKTATEVGFDMWVLHADHITVKKGTSKDIEETKRLINAQIDAGFTSFAIDASHLYNFQGEDLREELSMNIDATTELAKHIEAKMMNKPFGLEVEVGEIGKENEFGKVITTPEEAVTFVKARNENDVYPQVLAIANGTTHGNVYDEYGCLIEQMSIDIPRTIAIAKALRDNNLDVRIAQHGITGTPRELINAKFPKGDIIKGNVATFWQNLFLNALKVYQPELYNEIYSWTISTYEQKNPNKSDNEIFGKNVKNAIKQFYNRIYEINEGTIATIEALAYAEARIFLKAFGSEGTASIVRNALKEL
jgi:fructose-bisphosphate aldolase class II